MKTIAAILVLLALGCAGPTFEAQPTEQAADGGVVDDAGVATDVVCDETIGPPPVPVVPPEAPVPPPAAPVPPPMAPTPPPPAPVAPPIAPVAPLPAPVPPPPAPTPVPPDGCPCGTEKAQDCVDFKCKVFDVCSICREPEIDATQ